MRIGKIEVFRLQRWLGGAARRGAAGIVAARLSGE
jgi:hypothetical protein